MSYYAVRKGRNRGVYRTWSDCQNEVHGYSGARFKKFGTWKEANNFVQGSDSGHRSVSVYTDGSCHRNGRYNSRAGMGVYFGRNSPMNVSEPLRGRATNNRAEINAARRAVEQAGRHGMKDITLHTDSQFTINGMTKWKRNWEQNGWRTTTGEPVKNKDDFQGLDRAIRQSGVNVQWEHVRGHQGNRGNAEADRLANNAAYRY